MNTKTVLATCVIAATCLSQTFALSPVSESWSGQWKDARYVVSARSGEHLRSVAWDPEKADPPFTVKRAIAAARVSLKKIVGDAHVHFDCQELLIVDSTGRNGPWHYVVKFWSDHPSMVKTEVIGPKGEIGTYPAIFPFVVYLNGVVEEPEKTSG